MLVNFFSTRLDICMDAEASASWFMEKTGIIIEKPGVINALTFHPKSIMIGCKDNALDKRIIP